MTPLEFLRALWPDEGYYCLAFPFKHGFFHRIFDTIEGAAEHALEVRQTQDVFFCVNTLAERRVWSETKIDYKTGQPGAWEERTHRNMAWAKCFFADLDVGASTAAVKKFPAQGDAVRALEIFLEKTGLPWPTINSSGRGCHIFWPLASKMHTADWKPNATKLKRLMHHHSLWADPSRVDDESSVLRVAGTFHLKDPARPRAVQTEYSAVATPSADFCKLVADAYVRAGMEAAPEVARPPGRRANIAGSGSFTSGPAPSIDAVGKSCAQIRWLVQNAATLDNNQWYQGILQTFRHVADGRLVIDVVSAQHGDRLTRVDEKLQQLESGDIGPTTCTHMAEMCGDALCQACPLFGKVKAPLSAARKMMISLPLPVVTPQIIVQADEDGDAVPQPPEIPAPPWPWARSEAGIVRELKTEKGDIDPKKIYDLDLHPLAVIANDSTKIMQSEWRAMLPRDRGVVDFLVDTTALYDPRGMIQTVMNTGMVIKPENLNDVRDYMIDYLKELQKYVDDNKQFSHLGWMKDYKSFIMHDKILSAGESRKSNLSGVAQSAAENIGKTGTLERQVELVRFYNRPEWTGLQFFILCSLGAPLFYKTLQRGVVVNASGESGASKSSAMFTGASFWGHPELYCLNGGNRGMTPLFRNQRMATLANLPFCMDEITLMSNEDVQDMVMHATQAKAEKGGLRSNSTERASITSCKSTIMMCTANSSLHEKLSVKNQAGTAGSMRVFEMFFKECDSAFKPASHMFMADLHQNYGHIGEAFMIEYLKHQVEYEARVTAKILEIDLTENMSVAERFWSAIMAVSLVAGEIAFEQGLLPYDTVAIRAWLHRRQIPAMRGIVTTSYSRPADVLADYIDKITPDILVVNKSAGNIYAPKGVRGSLIARFETHAGLLWVHKQTFKEHCQRIGANMGQIVDALVASGVVTGERVQKTLGAGTEYAHGQTWCIQVNMAHPAMTGKAAAITTPEAPQKVISLRRP